MSARKDKQKIRTTSLPVGSIQNSVRLLQKEKGKGSGTY
jgi:hypothetical protein